MSDPANGWCCKGITYDEHVSQDGKCCQEKDTSLHDLPIQGKVHAWSRIFWSAAGVEKEIR